VGPRPQLGRADHGCACTAVLQNIGGENAGDAFYRYKMPKLIAKVKGASSGLCASIPTRLARCTAGYGLFQQLLCTYRPLSRPMCNSQAAPAASIPLGISPSQLLLLRCSVNRLKAEATVSKQMWSTMWTSQRPWSGLQNVSVKFRTLRRRLIALMIWSCQGL
jgi:hypothetical protein